MFTAILLFLIGLSLSAFFSGSEIGFYRVTRLRLLMDALAGNWTAKGLLWAVNNPSFLIATLLVGNNLANYLISLAIVLATDRMFPGHETAEIMGPLLMQPLVFVYGELLPKNIFFDAPNRLLRRGAPGLLVAGVLFAPISLLLWAVSKLIALVGRHSPQEIQRVLARRELAEVLAEGHAVGLLEPSQQILSKATFALASEPIRNFMTPVARYPRATTAMSRRDVERLAQRQRRTILPVEEPGGRRVVVGYVRLMDCVFDGGETLPIRPLLVLQDSTTYLAALSRLLETGDPIASIQNTQGQTLGLVTLRELQQVLLRGQ